MTNEARIAVVDDDQGMREAIGNMVLSIGHVPRCYASATQFLADPQRAAFACIILDIKMPGMTGLDLQNLLMQGTDRTPIIFLSSYAEGSVHRQARAGGARCVLVKPVDEALLISCIEAALASPLTQG